VGFTGGSAGRKKQAQEKKKKGFGAKWLDGIGQNEGKSVSAVCPARLEAATWPGDSGGRINGIARIIGGEKVMTQCSDGVEGRSKEIVGAQSLESNLKGEGQEGLGFPSWGIHDKWGGGTIRRGGPIKRSRLRENEIRSRGLRSGSGLNKAEPVPGGPKFLDLNLTKEKQGGALGSSSSGAERD